MLPAIPGSIIAQISEESSHGILKPGWAMNRNNPARIDTAIPGHCYDAATGQMGFVVENAAVSRPPE